MHRDNEQLKVLTTMHTTCRVRDNAQLKVSYT